MNNIITSENCSQHYKLDVAIFKKQLSKYDKNDPKYSSTYTALLDTFVLVLSDKYESFIEDMIDDIPENDLEIYADLED